MSWREKLVLIIGILVAFFSFLGIIVLNIRPTIKLNGNKTVELNLDETYKEEGATVRYFYFNLNNRLKISNNIDSKKIGNYEVTYEVTFNKRKTIKKRKVKVLDKIAPTITLNGENKVTLCPGKPYTEEGYVATDNIDGDITSKVTTLKYKNFLYYQVLDKSYNIAKVKREIINIDNEKPTITLNGNSLETVLLNSSYKDPGVNVTDNCDQDIETKVKVNGSVDVSKVGEYTITYEVSDSSNNTSTISRLVKVVNIPPNNQNLIYLTFDDGPSQNTIEILKILKENDIKATFFITGASNQYDYLIKQAMTEGHTIALHSYTHDYEKIYASIDAYFNDLMAVQNRVYNVTGLRPILIRFPGGSSNTVSRFNPKIMTYLASEVTNKGFIYFDWNVSAEDAGSAKTVYDIYYNVIKDLRPNRSNIVLMHDASSKTLTVEALKQVIIYAKANGYVFAPLTSTSYTAHHRINN